MGHVCRRGLAVMGTCATNVMTSASTQPSPAVGCRGKSAHPPLSSGPVDFVLMTWPELALSCPPQWFESPWGAFGDVTVRNPALVFLTSNEAADLLRLSRRTLERWRLEGNGPRYIKLGVGKRSRVVYREAEIEAWVSRSSFGSTSEYPTR